MKITSLNIKNFKSIVDITINEPNPFTVFVGPNGSGKSNIFEALEFANLAKNERLVAEDSSHSEIEELVNQYSIEEVFGGKKNIFNFNSSENSDIDFDITLKFPFNNHTHFVRHTWYINDMFKTDLSFTRVSSARIGFEESKKMFKVAYSEHKAQLDNFHRIFIGKAKIEKQKINSDKFLSLSTSNLEKVLVRLLENKSTREEIIEWLELFIPEFKDIKVRKSDFQLQVYQKYYEEPFTENLISDGTYNILCLLTAVLQSDEPQFLCIEEPENGLNPFVIRKLVDFFRQSCEDIKGKRHYIWLNTHSQTLVECLKPEELIVVDKVNGETQVKQFKGMDLHGLDMSELWLSGALGGGTPW